MSYNNPQLQNVLHNKNFVSMNLNIALLSVLDYPRNTVFLHFQLSFATSSSHTLLCEHAIHFRLIQEQIRSSEDYAPSFPEVEFFTK